MVLEHPRFEVDRGQENFLLLGSGGGVRGAARWLTKACPTAKIDMPRYGTAQGNLTAIADKCPVLADHYQSFRAKKAGHDKEHECAREGTGPLAGPSLGGYTLDDAPILSSLARAGGSVEANPHYWPDISQLPKDLIADWIITGFRYNSLHERESIL